MPETQSACPASFPRPRDNDVLLCAVWLAQTAGIRLAKGGMVVMDFLTWDMDWIDLQAKDVLGAGRIRAMAL